MINKTSFMMLVLLMLSLLSACTPNETIEEENLEPELSSIFSIPVVFEDEKKGEHVLVGEKGKIAFLIGSGVENNIEMLPIIENKPNKYLWYFWGENLSGKSFEVIGTNVETKQETVILDNLVVGAELNGADGHTPSLMEFPNARIWKLDAYVDEELFGNIIMEVE